MRERLATLRQGVVAALLAVAVLAFSLPDAALTARAAQGNQGLQGGWAVGDAGDVVFPHSLATQLPIMREAGAGWVRINFRLGQCFKDWTSKSCRPDRKSALRVYDEVVNAARANGLQVLGLVSNESWRGAQDKWTASNAERRGGSGDNGYIKAFAKSAAGVLAKHFKGRISHWEVWNEPNAWTQADGSGNFSGGSFLYPSNFAWLLKRSYAAIKSAQPGAVVVAGGLFAHDPLGVTQTVVVEGKRVRITKRGDQPGERSTAGDPGSAAEPCAAAVPDGADSGADYLCATYRMGIARAGWKSGAYPFDHLAQHLYLDIGDATTSEKIGQYLQDLRGAYLAYEGAQSPKKIVVTEVGWTTEFVSAATQAANLQSAYEAFGQTSYVARAFWFSVQDVPEGNLFYGLVDTNGSAKPSFAAYQEHAGS
jgi:hypothetical protein